MKVYVVFQGFIFKGVYSNIEDAKVKALTYDTPECKFEYSYLRRPNKYKGIYIAEKEISKDQYSYLYMTKTLY